jgi:membrane-associated phospholipid phosphatase
MLKVFERALNPCKPGDSGTGTPRPPWSADKHQLQRVSVWMVLSLSVLALAFLLDGLVGRALTLQSSTSWRDLALYSSKAGEGWVIAVAGALGSLFLFLVRRFEASGKVFLVAVTGLLTGAAATIIRSLLGRTRPDSHALQGFYGVWYDSHWIIGKYEFGAFPSGHVATVVGLATAAWLIDRRVGMLAACYALLVTWSRIALGCHHFSDTIAAAIVGFYGAHLLLAWLGPGIGCFGEHWQNAWLGRKRSFASSKQSQS